MQERNCFNGLCDTVILFFFTKNIDGVDYLSLNFKDKYIYEPK